MRGLEENARDSERDLEEWLRVIQSTVATANKTAQEKIKSAGVVTQSDDEVSKLTLKQQYSQQIAHTRQQELEYAKATAAADEKALADRITNLETLRDYQTLNALTVEADQTDLEIQKAKAELLKQQIEDQIKLSDLASEWRKQMTNQVLDMVSSDLAKLSMGQHKQVHVGKDMERIGGNMAQSAIKSALQMTLAHFGKKGSIKPTLTDNDPGYVIVKNMPNGGGNLPGGPTIANAAGVPGMAGVAGRSNSAGSALGGIFGGLLQGLLGGGKGASGAAAESVTSSIEFLADGGDTYPGRSYVVGDGGEPEMFTPGVRGTVTPFSKMGGGGNTILNIDARGTDPVLTEMRVRQAIVAAHNNSVATGVQATAERAKRTVQR